MSQRLFLKIHYEGKDILINPSQIKACVFWTHEDTGKSVGNTFSYPSLRLDAETADTVFAQLQNFSA